MKTAIARASAALVAAALLPGAATAQTRSGPSAAAPPPSTWLPVATRWTAALPAPAAAPPTAGGERLFAVLFDGRVAAVSLVDGSALWQIEQPVSGRPAAGGGLVHVPTPSGLLALDARTGAVRWQAALEAPVSAPLLWKAGWLIAALEGGVLLALHAGNGGTVWRQVVDGGVGVRPTIGGDRLYVPLDGGRIVVLDLLTGNPVWERRLDGAPREILLSGDLFVGATDNHFYRLSRRDGALRWRWRAGGDVAGLPAVDEQHVYFSSLDNTLRALDRSNGAQRWRELLPVRPTGGPRRAEDLIVQGGLTRELSLRGGADGTVYHRLRVPSELAFAPLVFPDPLSDGLVLVLVTDEGEVQAIGRAGGPVRLDPAVTDVWERLAPVAEGEGEADSENEGVPDEPDGGGVAEEPGGADGAEVSGRPSPAGVPDPPAPADSPSPSAPAGGPGRIS